MAVRYGTQIRRTGRLYGNATRRTGASTVKRRIWPKREEIIEAYHEVMEALTDTTDLDTEREQLQSECEVVMGLIRKVIEDNAQKAMDQAEYEEKYTWHL